MIKRLLFFIFLYLGETTSSQNSDDKVLDHYYPKKHSQLKDNLAKFIADNAGSFKHFLDDYVKKSHHNEDDQFIHMLLKLNNYLTEACEFKDELDKFIFYTIVKRYHDLEHISDKNGLLQLDLGCKCNNEQPSQIKGKTRMDLISPPVTVYNPSTLASPMYRPLKQIFKKGHGIRNTYYTGKDSEVNTPMDTEEDLGPVNGAARNDDDYPMPHSKHKTQRKNVDDVVDNIVNTIVKATFNEIDRSKFKRLLKDDLKKFPGEESTVLANVLSQLNECDNAFPINKQNNKISKDNFVTTSKYVYNSIPDFGNPKTRADDIGPGKQTTYVPYLNRLKDKKISRMDYQSQITNGYDYSQSNEKLLETNWKDDYWPITDNYGIKPQKTESRKHEEEPSYSFSSQSYENSEPSDENFLSIENVYSDYELPEIDISTKPSEKSKFEKKIKYELPKKLLKKTEFTTKFPIKAKFPTLFQTKTAKLTKTKSKLPTKIEFQTEYPTGFPTEFPTGFPTEFSTELAAELPVEFLTEFPTKSKLPEKFVTITEYSTEYPTKPILPISFETKSEILKHTKSELTKEFPTIPKLSTTFGTKIELPTELSTKPDLRTQAELPTKSKSPISFQTKAEILTKSKSESTHEFPTKPKSPITFQTKIESPTEFPTKPEVQTKFPTISEIRSEFIAKSKSLTKSSELPMKSPTKPELAIESQPKSEFQTISELPTEFPIISELSTKLPKMLELSKQFPTMPELPTEFPTMSESSQEDSQYDESSEIPKIIKTNWTTKISVKPKVSYFKKTEVQTLKPKITIESSTLPDSESETSESQEINEKLTTQTLIDEAVLPQRSEFLTTPGFSESTSEYIKHNSTTQLSTIPEINDLKETEITNVNTLKSIESSKSSPESDKSESISLTKEISEMEFKKEIFSEAVDSIFDYPSKDDDQDTFIPEQRTLDDNEESPETIEKESFSNEGQTTILKSYTLNKSETVLEKPNIPKHVLPNTLHIKPDTSVTETSEASSFENESQSLKPSIEDEEDTSESESANERNDEESDESFDKEMTKLRTKTITTISKNKTIEVKNEVKGKENENPLTDQITVTYQTLKPKHLEEDFHEDSNESYDVSDESYKYEEIAEKVNLSKRNNDSQGEYDEYVSFEETATSKNEPKSTVSYEPVTIGKVILERTDVKDANSPINDTIDEDEYTLGENVEVTRTKKFIKSGKPENFVKEETFENGKRTDCVSYTTDKSADTDGKDGITSARGSDEDDSPKLNLEIKPNTIKHVPSKYLQKVHVEHKTYKNKPEKPKKARFDYHSPVTPQYDYEIPTGGQNMYIQTTGKNYDYKQPVDIDYDFNKPGRQSSYKKKISKHYGYKKPTKYNYQPQYDYEIEKPLDTQYGYGSPAVTEYTYGEPGNTQYTVQKTVSSHDGYRNPGGLINHAATSPAYFETTIDTPHGYGKPEILKYSVTTTNPKHSYGNPSNIDYIELGTQQDYGGPLSTGYSIQSITQPPSHMMTEMQSVFGKPGHTEFTVESTSPGDVYEMSMNTQSGYGMPDTKFIRSMKPSRGYKKTVGTHNDYEHPGGSEYTVLKKVHKSHGYKKPVGRQYNVQTTTGPQYGRKKPLGKDYGYEKQVMTQYGNEEPVVTQYSAKKPVGGYHKQRGNGQANSKFSLGKLLTLPNAESVNSDEAREVFEGIHRAESEYIKLPENVTYDPIIPKGRGDDVPDDFPSAKSRNITTTTTTTTTITKQPKYPLEKLLLQLPHPNTQKDYIKYLRVKHLLIKNKDNLLNLYSNNDNKNLTDIIKDFFQLQLSKGVDEETNKAVRYYFDHLDPSERMDSEEYKPETELYADLLPVPMNDKEEHHYVILKKYLTKIQPQLEKLSINYKENLTPKERLIKILTFLSQSKDGKKYKDSIDYYLLNKFDLKNIPNFSYVSLLKYLPASTDEVGKKHYETIKNFLTDFEIFLLLEFIDPTQFDDKLELFKILATEVMNADVSKDIKDAFVYYFGEPKLVKIQLLTHKEITKKYDLTSIILDTLLYESFSLENRQAFNIFIDYISNINDSTLQQFDGWYYVKTQGQFIKELFNYILSLDNVSSTVKDAVKKLIPLVNMSGNGSKTVK